MSEGSERREVASAGKIGATAFLLAASVLLSRVLGYGREALLAHVVGVGARADAYYAAFTIPDLLNYLLAGGALSIAFLPSYMRRRESHGDAEADRLLGMVLGTLTSVATVLTAILWWQAENVCGLLFPQFGDETLALTARVVRIVLPAQIFFVAGGVINAALFARGRFGAAAIAPLVYNGGIIIGGLLLAPRWGVEGFAWGVLAGAAGGPFLAPLLDARRRIRVWPSFAPFHREFLAYLALAAPLMLGQSLLTVDEWYERIFGATVAVGGVAALAYARKLMLVPVAIVGQAVAMAALPVLSQLWAEAKTDELNRVVTLTLRRSLAAAVLAAAGLWALASPLVSILYQHGKFTADDAEAVTGILVVLALAVPAWVAQQILARAFYARADTFRPMAMGTVLALAAIPLYAELADRWGIVGIAWAGVAAMSVNALATYALARRLHGAPRVGELAATLARSAAVAVVAGWAARWLTEFLLLPQFSLLFGALLRLGSGGLVFVVIAGIGIRLFGDEDLRTVLRGRRRRGD